MRKNGGMGTALILELSQSAYFIGKALVFKSFKNMFYGHILIRLYSELYHNILFL